MRYQDMTEDQLRADLKQKKNDLKKLVKDTPEYNDIITECRGLEGAIKALGQAYKTSVTPMVVTHEVDNVIDPAGVVMWKPAPGGDISPRALMTWLRGHGFVVDSISRELFHISNGVINNLGKPSDEEARGYIKRFIRACAVRYSATDTETFLNELEGHLAEGIIDKEFMTGFPEEKIIETQDTADTMYIPFNGNKLVITRDGIKESDYTAEDRFHSARIPRHAVTRTAYKFRELNDRRSEFEQFLRDITIPEGGDETNFLLMCGAIGYLLSGHKDGSEKMVVIYDTPREGEDDGSDNAGTGKSLLIECIMACTYSAESDGKSFDPDEQFAFDFIEPGMRIAFIDDLRQNFDFERFYNKINGAYDQQRKYKKRRFIQSHEAPKWAGTANYRIRGGTGSHADRRLFEFEILEYYNSANPVSAKFGHKFLAEWDEPEYMRFYTFIARCCVAYLRNGLVKPVLDTSGQRRRLVSETCEEFVSFMDGNIMNYNKADGKKGWVMDDAFVQYMDKIMSMPYVSDWARKVDKTKFRRWCSAYVKYKQKEWGDLKGLHGIKVSHSRTDKTIQLCVERETRELHLNGPGTSNDNKLLASSVTSIFDGDLFGGKPVDPAPTVLVDNDIVQSAAFEEVAKLQEPKIKFIDLWD